MNNKSRQPFSRWINEKLAEPEGQTFKDGKWRFWFLMLVGLGALNALLTAKIFSDNSSPLDALWTIVLCAGALICWIAVGTLHYSDSGDAQLARGVSLLDSITLCFVVAHFCGLLWVYGHLLTLRAAEAKYEAQAKVLNDDLKKISTDNTKIAEAATAVAKLNEKRARLENDTAYQLRIAAKSGAQIHTPRAQGQNGLSPSLSTSPVELERPKPPPASSTDFLQRWDARIRLANFGELILAAITLIYIRNRSAAFNAKNAPTVNYGSVMTLPATVAPLRRGDTGNATAVATVAGGQNSTLKALREHLKVIAFEIPNHWFKVDPIIGGVTIRLCRREKGRELTVKQTRQSDKILAAVDRPDFPERLRAELIACGFPIGGGER